MALVNRSFSVNVTPGMMPPIVHVSEYDVGRAYTVSILDEQGNTFTIPSGTTASIEGTLNGAVGFTQSATISNNRITFALTESMTAYSGKAWCKIKLTLNDEPIQTCAFVLAVDRAGVEAGTVIGASGFEQQITDAVDAWLDEHPPASGGMTEAFKQALLDCFENVAWINDDGQTYYDALYTALYPSADLLSISAVFTQGSAVIYDTDSLDTLKQYLVVTAIMTDSTTQTVTNYTLSGTLAVGISTITVSYGGKTTTFDVAVSDVPAQDGIYTPTTITRGKTFDSETGQIIDASANSAVIEDYIRVSNLAVVTYTNPPSGSVTWTVCMYDSGKSYIGQFVVNQTSNINSGITNAIVKNAAYVRLYWYNPYSTEFTAIFSFDNNIVQLNTQIGDINASSGNIDSTVSSRACVQDYIEVSDSVLAVSGCPFAASWSDWTINGGYGIRCYDSQKEYLGYVSPSGGGLFKTDISNQALQASTKYVRLIFQKDNSNFPDISDVAKRPFGINGSTSVLVEAET